VCVSWQAADLGETNGVARIGQILSPLSDIPFTQKDATRAVQIFESVRERSPNDPVMCFEYAKLLLNGVEKNVELARKLWEVGRIEEPNVPPLVEIRNEPEQVEGYGFKGKLLMGIGVAVIFAAGIFWALRSLKGTVDKALKK
jgi:hypothetical protein